MLIEAILYSFKFTYKKYKIKNKYNMDPYNSYNSYLYMIQPIKLQHLLNEYIKTALPLINSVFISTMDGSCIASTNI